MTTQTDLWMNYSDWLHLSSNTSTGFLCPEPHRFHLSRHRLHPPSTVRENKLPPRECSASRAVARLIILVNVCPSLGRDSHPWRRMGGRGKEWEGGGWEGEDVDTYHTSALWPQGRWRAKSGALGASRTITILYCPLVWRRMECKRTSNSLRRQTL